MSFYAHNATPSEQHNRREWNKMAAAGHPFTRPATESEFASPLAAVDGDGWLGSSVRGLCVLCLAAGGGRHGPLLAAAGADVTVVDLSPVQLQLDREVAHQRGLQLRTVEASLDDLSGLAAATFDLVVQPVSTCYVAHVHRVWSEVARVTRGGALYVSQHKTPVNLQLSQAPHASGYVVSEPYYRRGPLPPEGNSRHRERGTLEHLHRWEQLLGGMCRAGFVIEDVLEPRHADERAAPGSFGHRSCYAAPYVRIKARRRCSSPAAAGRLAAIERPRVVNARLPALHPTHSLVDN